MNLFDKIPENFFSILVSKNKNIYIQALFVLREAFSQEMSISKDNLISRLINNLEEEFLEIDFLDELEDIEIPKDNNVSAKAYFLLRKLKGAGWIEIEIQRDSFEEYINLPNYSIKMINLLYLIANEEKAEFNSYVFSTYSNLKIAKLEPDKTYEAIIVAYENTMNLLNELKTLYNSLGIYHKKMCNKETINEIVKEHFLDYKEYSDEMIYPLITRDSIPRYKGPIKEMLKDILSNQELLQNIAIDQVTKKRYQDKEQAQTDILTKMRTILEIYEKLDGTMQQIENKNNDYVRASVQRINYLLTSDKELKGKLIKVIKNIEKSAVLETIQQETNLIKEQYLCQDSLYLRTKQNKKQGTPEAIIKIELDNQEAMKDLSKTIEKQYSNRQIEDFMQRQMKGKPYIDSKEMQIASTEDLILLILATIRADNSKKMSYYLQDSNEQINNNGYQIPNIRFIKRR